MQGWKKTPAGHLVRPLQLRPAHPIPVPQPVLPTDVKGKGKATPHPETSGDKPKRKKKMSNRPTKRARILTIDPTRYPRSHLTGPLLEAEAEAVDADGSPSSGDVPGSRWACEESKGKDGMLERRWNLIDKAGSVLRTELVSTPDRKAASAKAPQANLDTNTQDSSESSSSSSSVSSSSSSASSTSTSDSSDSESEPKSGGEAIPRLQKFTADDGRIWQTTPYDPDAEAEFSDGYDELSGVVKAAGGTKAALKLQDVTAERSETMNLLAQMFGSELDPEEERDGTLEFAEVQKGDEEDDDDDDLFAGLSRPKAHEAAASQEEANNGGKEDEDDLFAGLPRAKAHEVPVPEQESESDSTSESEESDVEMQVQEEEVPPPPPQADELAARKARRAALLGKAADAAAKSSNFSFQPIQRFVPVDEDIEAAMPASAQGADGSDSDDSDEQADVTEKAYEPESTTQKAISSSEDKSTNYQLTSLKDMFKPKEAEKTGFSLMAELDLELDNELDFDLMAEQQEQEQQQRQQASLDEVARLVALEEAEPSVVAPLPFPRFDPSNPRDMVQMLQKGLYIPFIRTDSEEEIQERWEQHRSKLTQEYKRRHREAVKKKRRHISGTRAKAGLSGAAGPSGLRIASISGRDEADDAL